MSKLLFQIKISICLGLLLLPQVAQGAEVSLSARVDRTEVRLGESLQLQIIVQGTRKSPQPQIPKTKHFKLSYHGQSSQFNMVNGKITSSVTYTYSVLPLKEGQFSIGPARVNYKGKRLASNPIKLRVLPANAKLKEAEPLILQATVSNPSPYYNQQVIYTLRLARRVEVVNARVELPEFTGFWVEDLGEQREGQQVINGYTYAVTELRKALFPNKTGPLQIESASIHCEVVTPRSRDRRRSFFSFRHRTARKILRSPSVKLEVKELPKAGRPADFYPLVGEIQIESELSKKKLEAGDSSTLTITVSGNANMRDAGLLEPERLEGFKVYDDKPGLELIPQEDGLLGRKTFKKALVPLKPGQPQVPVYKVPYFNPKSKRYELASTKPISLLVKASAEKEQLHALGAVSGAAPKKEIKILGRDILSVYTHPKALEDENLSSQEQLLYGLFFMLPPGIFLGLVSVRTKSRLYQKNAVALRKKKAFKRAGKKLKNVSPTAGAVEFYPQISKVIKEYLGDKLGLPGGALTPQETQIKLEAAGVEEKSLNQLKDLLEECEFCQFASSDQGGENCRQVFKNTQQLLAQLERHL